MASPMNFSKTLKRTRNDLPKYDPNGFTNLEEMMICLEKNLSEYSDDNFSEIASREETETPRPAQFESKEERLWEIESMNDEEEYTEKAELVKANIKQVEGTRMQIYAETQERIILWLKDQQDNMASTENPFDKAIIWRYHKMMGVHRYVTEAIVRHVASIEDVFMHKDLVRAFAPLLYAAKTSSLKSDDVISLVQEFDECFKKTKDAIKCLENSFFVCRKPRNEDRIIQKILKYLRNPYHSKTTQTELMEALIKEAERTQKQIDAETQERIIQWLKDQRDNMTITIHPFEKEIIWWYHKMMGVFRQLREAVVPLVATIENVALHKDVVRAFVLLLHAAETSSLRSDNVNSFVQEFHECFESTMDAIKCSDDSFFDCPKQREEDRILQKILKDLQNRYEAYETEGTEEMKKDGFDFLMAVNTAVNVICPLPAYSNVIRL